MLTLWSCRFRDRDLLHKLFTEKRVGLYAGVDPTGPSLHVGHMLPFMILAWGYVWGLPVTFLVSYRGPDGCDLQDCKTDQAAQSSAARLRGSVTQRGGQLRATKYTRRSEKLILRACIYS